MIDRTSAAGAVFAMGAFLSLLVGPTRADITLEQRISVQGVGIMSAGNMAGTSKTTISGDRSRTDSDLQMQSRLVRMLAHRALGPTAEIVRLDEGKVYHLKLDKKQYTEMSFDELHAQMQLAKDRMSSQGGPEGQSTPAPLDESQCEWLPPKAEVKKTGEKATFAGFAAERVQITASQPCKDKKTGAICEIALSLDEWLAPDFNGGDEALKFHRAYAQKMGLDVATMQDASARAQAMFGRYKGVWSEIAMKMKDAKGYPVKSSFALALGGAQCQKGQEQPQETGTADNSAGGGGSLTSQISGKLAGALFHRKQEDAQAASAQAGAAPPVPAGTMPIMTITSELVSVSTAAVAPGGFEVPGDFKKMEK